ncbi:hypothetical protein ACFUMH_10915 [Cellulomonas sp. NPDC057328]|uniref:hypothetical protein n=1 Tax=Cellulomonas sp. NPDC057328 TaxID=3346101 RepID=UPI0036338B3F
MADGWTYDDALVLSAAAMIPRLHLHEAVSVIDAMGHTVLGDDQFDAAVGRLVGSGLLVVDPGPVLGLTDEGREIVGRRRPGLIDQVFSVQELLGDVPLTPTRWTSPVGAYERAVDRHLRPWRFWRRLGR